MSVDVMGVEDVVLPNKFLDEFRGAFVGQLDEETLAEAVEELEKILKATENGDTGLECGITDATADIGLQRVSRAASGELLVRGVIGGTRLNVSVQNGELNCKTAGGKKFKGKNAKGSGSGIGYLDKSSSKIYTDTTSYELSPGKILDTIVFKNASKKKLGTWTGKFVPKVPAGSGPGRWDV